MPYKCTACGKYYREASEELRQVMINGNCACGKRFLTYIRSPVDANIFEEIEELNAGEQEGEESPPEEAKPPEPAEPVEDNDWFDKKFVHDLKTKKQVKLGIETIKMMEEGMFELDVPSLMHGKPIVFNVKEGVYYIDVAHAMRKKK
ncbi:MAG: hypothetical protein MSIBF_05170 [Candidatus Altiarchaeales archaeon IMC4]|nr:MAG: hypothetical protein MSIBF_05170 [Candidatus Altiarchaeales archaeon IMC4]